VRGALLPNSKPLADGFVGSGFGWRPTLSRERWRAMKESTSPPRRERRSTPRLGRRADRRVPSEYGNVVEIDHGNQLMTRYAHALRLGVGRATSSSAARRSPR